MGCRSGSQQGYLYLSLAIHQIDDAEARIERALYEATIRPGAELVAGADGVGEGIPASRAGEQVPKFHEDALMVVRAGGAAGLFSAILPGWLAGRSRTELQPVTKEIRE